MSVEKVISQTGGTSGGTYAQHFTGRLTVTETSYSIANNTSTLSYKLELISGSSGRFYGYTADYSVSINGSVVKSGSGTYESQTYNTAQTICEGTVTITHNADGTKTGMAIGGILDFMSGTYSPGDFNLSGTMDLTTIPRYATCTQSLNTKTLNTIKMNWSSDSTIDYVWYSVNNGSSWTAVGSVNASSGNYTITNLSNGSTYNIKTRVRRKDSQLTTDSSNLAVTTYGTATISSAPNFNHGSSETITYSNPSGQTLAIKIGNAADTVNYTEYRTCTGSSYTFNFTDAELDKIYKAFGNNSTLTVKVWLRTTCNGSNYWNGKDVTITLKGNQKTIRTNVSGTWRRGKTWLNVSGSWKQAVVWEKVNGTWRRGI